MPTTAAARADLGELTRRVHEGSTRLRALLEQMLVAPTVLDRALLGELATYLDHHAWVSVEAAELLAAHTPSGQVRRP